MWRSGSRFRTAYATAIGDASDNNASEWHSASGSAPDVGATSDCAGNWTDAGSADRASGSHWAAGWRTVPDAADHGAAVHAELRIDADVWRCAFVAAPDLCARGGACGRAASDDSDSCDVSADWRGADRGVVPAAAQGLPRPS